MKLKKCVKCKKEVAATLENFFARNQRKSGLSSWCKDCHNEWQRPRHYQRVRQEKIKLKLIASFLQPMLCYFCGEPVTLLNGKKAESIAIHSLDVNHENWDYKNKTPPRFLYPSFFHKI